jgi:hypothetical protein
MQLSGSSARCAERCGVRGTSGSGAAPACGGAAAPPARSLAGRGAAAAHVGLLAGRVPRAASRARRVDALAADGDTADAPASQKEQDAGGVSLDDASSLLTSVESDLQRFKDFEAQNEAGITRLAGIVVQPQMASVATAGGGSARGGPGVLSPEQLARVWKARASERHTCLFAQPRA